MTYYTHAYTFIYTYIYTYKCDSILYMVFYISREYGVHIRMRTCVPIYLHYTLATCNTYYAQNTCTHLTYIYARAHNRVKHHAFYY